MSNRTRHRVEALLSILHDSAAEKSAMLARELNIACRSGEALRAYLRRMDQQLGESAVLGAAQSLLARLQIERGGHDRVT